MATVVAHEITHSWTGNLITNRNFEHFWLNEGFTIFVERKIKGRLENSSFQDFDAYLGLSELRETVSKKILLFLFKHFVSFNYIHFMINTFALVV